MDLLEGHLSELGLMENAEEGWVSFPHQKWRPVN
jgi:hypothetical protein